MKKLSNVFPIIFLLWIIGAGSVFAEDNEKKDATLNELSKKFTEAGVKKDDIKAVNSAAKNLIAKGATRDDIKGFIGSAKKTGLNSEEITASLNVMNELVNEGVKPKAAGNLVSQAAHDAKAKGLTGKDLSAKVQETIEQKKKEYYEFMKRKEKQKKSNKAKGKKAKNKEKKHQQ